MHFSIISFFLYSNANSRHLGGTEDDKNSWRKQLFARKEQNRFLSMGSHHLADVPRLLYDQEQEPVAQLKKTRENQPVEDVVPVEGSSDKSDPVTLEDDDYYRPRRFTSNQVDVEVTAEYGSKWNMDNNCGPRPSGPKYPAPPETSADQYKKQFYCDIIPEAVYLPGYRCNTTCQNDETVTVSLYCDCYNNFLNFAVVKPCEWIFIDDVSCPPVADPPNWECDPRVEDCGTTYPTPEPSTTTPSTTATMILTTSSTTLPATTASSAAVTDDWMEGLHSTWLQWQAQKASEPPVGDGKDVSGFTYGGIPYAAAPTGGLPGGVSNIFNIQPVLSNAMGNSGTTDPAQPISTKNNLTDVDVENLKTEILLMKTQRTSIQEQLDEIRREMAL